MVQHVNTRQPAVWTAVLAVSVAGGALLWHLLACIESPMAFSPSGKDLAFVTMEPYGNDDPVVAGPHAYRLMILTGGKELRIVEEAVADMLTAPAYSPDGRQLCYLRIPLLTPEGLERLQQSMSKRNEALGQIEPLAWTSAPAQPAAAAATTQPAPQVSVADAALPPFRGIQELCDNLATQPRVPATLVIRDAATDAVLSNTPVELPVGEKNGFALLYVTLRPQFSPDAKSIYFCSGDLAMAVNTSNGEQRVLAAPAAVAALAPDGKTLATLQQSALGFVQTSGEAALYRRWAREPSLSGLTWVDAKTLAVLETAGREADVHVHLFGLDGTLRKTLTLRLPEHGEHREENMGELAIAPGGKHMVLAFTKDVFFTNAKGKLLHHWHSEEEQMAQPTFMPGAKQVAFKCLRQEPDDYQRVAAIAFFTPEGQEISRVPVPRLKPGTTRPASQPTTQSAAPWTR